MDDCKAEDDERQRLMGQRKLDWNDGEQRRNAERDLEQSHGCQDDRAARERQAGRSAHRNDCLNNREGDDSIRDHPMIELRRRRIAEYRLQHTWAKRLAWNKARSHERPGVVDEAGA